MTVAIRLGNSNPPSNRFRNIRWILLVIVTLLVIVLVIVFLLVIVCLLVIVKHHTLAPRRAPAAV